MKKHCCKEMDDSQKLSCDIHNNKFDCPNVLVSYIPKFDEYGIIIRDGGTSSISITFCPWCGTALPKSKRDAWFDALEELGYDDPTEQDIPKEFNNESWYKDT